MKALALALLAGALAALPASAANCPAGTAWIDFSSLTITSEVKIDPARKDNLEEITIRQFSDGSHARVKVDGRVMELIDLDRRYRIYRAYDPLDPTQRHTHFVTLWMGIGYWAELLKQRHPNPCDIGNASKPFSYTLPSKPADTQVFGDAYWEVPGKLRYRLSVTSAVRSDPPPGLRGEAEFLPKAPMPAELPLDGWIVVERDPKSSKERHIARPPSVRTLGELRAYLLDPSATPAQ